MFSVSIVAVTWMNRVLSTCFLYCSHPNFALPSPIQELSFKIVFQCKSWFGVVLAKKEEKQHVQQGQTKYHSAVAFARHITCSKRVYSHHKTMEAFKQMSMTTPRNTASNEKLLLYAAKQEVVLLSADEAISIVTTTAIRYSGWDGTIGVNEIVHSSYQGAWIHWFKLIPRPR